MLWHPNTPYRLPPHPVHAQLDNLESLDLSSNVMEALPSFFGMGGGSEDKFNLGKLRVLNLSANRLEVVSDSLAGAW